MSATHSGVSQVTDGFRKAAKKRRRVCPPNGEHKRDGHQGWQSSASREDHCKRRSILGLQVEATESILEIKFG